MQRATPHAPPQNQPASTAPLHRHKLQLQRSQNPDQASWEMASRAMAEPATWVRRASDWDLRHGHEYAVACDDDARVRSLEYGAHTRSGHSATWMSRWPQDHYRIKRQQMHARACKNRSVRNAWRRMTGSRSATHLPLVLAVARLAMPTRIDMESLLCSGSNNFGRSTKDFAPCCAADMAAVKAKQNAQKGRARGGKIARRGQNGKK